MVLSTLVGYLSERALGKRNGGGEWEQGEKGNLWNILTGRSENGFPKGEKRFAGNGQRNNWIVLPKS